MRAEYRERWRKEIANRTEPLKKPRDLVRRVLSSEDFIDSAIIGGVGVADILYGRIAESQIPSDVIDAFHAQYPQYGSSFVEAVKHLGSDPDKLAGLISGIKGKLFEIDYVNWLNHGHLPAGLTANLADSANNPGWDIAIHDGHGNVAEFLQLKATESLSYVRDAIAAHPEIDVVVPHELYNRLVDHPELVDHVLDGHQNLADLTHHVSDASDQAYGLGDHFPIVAPIVAVGLAATQNWANYRTGKISPIEMLQNVGERGLLAVMASGTGWAISALVHSSVVGIPVAMGIRMFGRQLFHNRDRRNLLTVYIETITVSRTKLEDQLGRCLLEGGAI